MLASLSWLLVEGAILGLIWWWDARARKARLRRPTGRPLRAAPERV